MSRATMGEASGQTERHQKGLAPRRSYSCGGEPVLVSPDSGLSQISGSLLQKSREAEVLPLFERPHRHLPNTEDSMDVKKVFKAREDATCQRARWEQGEELVNLSSRVGGAAGAAGERGGGQDHSHPTDAVTYHPASHCASTQGSGSVWALADVQVCEETALVSPLPVDALPSEWADAPAVNHCDLVKDGAGDPAPVLEMYAEPPGVRGDFSDDDDDLEYFECSDVLSAHENEIWQKKLEFLLGSDDEDDLNLSKDCDGCAYFLGDMPCRFQVSDNTTPMDASIGFCGHHSKLEGVNVSRDPSVCSQSALQAEMTLTCGLHREKSASVKDQEKCPAPVASAATGNDHPSAEVDNHGSAHSAAGSSADKPTSEGDTDAQTDSSAGGLGSPWTGRAAERMAESSTDEDLQSESSPLPEERGGDLSEENRGHTVCTLTESLRRNLLKLFNPKELCRYVSTIGQSFQLVAELRESSASSQGGVASTWIPEETESPQMQAALCHTEEADKDCHWERRRTLGLSEQNQIPDENVSSEKQSASLNLLVQDSERRCPEPEAGRESDPVTSESAIPPASEMVATEKTLQANHANLQTCSRLLAPWDKRESCPLQVTCEQGINIVSIDGNSKSEALPFPSWDRDSACEQQACSCAVLPPAELCEEPGEHRYSLESHDSNGTDALCSLSCHESPSEANLKAALESGEPGGKGDADISAVHDELWKLLNEDDSGYQITYESQGITSLEIRPIGSKATELNFAQETSSGHPLPVSLGEEQESTTQPAASQRRQKEDCNVSDSLLQTAEVRNSASTGNICLAQVVGTDGICLDSSTANKVETASICASANGAGLATGECLEQEPHPVLTGSGESVQVPAAGEGKPARNNSSQTCDGNSFGGLKDAPSGNPACGTEPPQDPSAVPPGTTGQLLHPEHSTPLAAEPVGGARCPSRGCNPAGPAPPRLPAEKDLSPAANTSQLAQEEHSAGNTRHKSCEEPLPEKEDGSAVKAQTATGSGSCHPSQSNSWQDLQAAPGAQRCSYEMPLTDATSESVTHENLPQNTGQQTEVAKQEAAPPAPPSPGGPWLRGFSVEPCKAGKQSKVCTGDEERAAASCDSGGSHGAESQTAASSHTSSQPDVAFVGSTFISAKELKADSPRPLTSAPGSLTPGSALLPSEAQSGHHMVAKEGLGDYRNQLETQRVTAQETPCTPMSQAGALLSSLPAEGCAGTGPQVETGSVQTVGQAEGRLGMLGTFCRAFQEHFHGVLELNKEEPFFCANKQEIQRTVECKPDKAEPKAPLCVLVSSEVQGQLMNTSTKQPSPDLISSNQLTQVEKSVSSAEGGKDEELMASESVVSALVSLPSADAVNSQHFQEQAPCRTHPFSSGLATDDPFPVSVEGMQNTGGSKSCQTSPAAAEPEPSPRKQGPAKSGHFTAGAKKKLPPATLSKKPRLEEGGNGSEDASCVRRAVKSEAGTTLKEDRKEQRKLILKQDGKAPRLLKKIQAELFPDRSGNLKLCCQFGDIHGDSSITWTKDSKLLARLHRSAQDDSPVSLAIAKASSKDQGMYYCCLSNTYGKVTAEFSLTAEVLEQLSSFQNCEGVEEIEFMQLMFREDFIRDSYFGGNLHGAIATEELHFGEGMHRKAFRSKVMRGLVPVFGPGHACVLKVHSAITYGTKSKDDLVQKNYKLALQECYVQNTAREYAKIYAAEAEPLEGFGEVPEIIPIFLVHRPANNIPYATVEEELIGEFVKYSMRDGKEINFLRRDSEAGQKCCTFQHWVYEKTNGSLLVTDLQGVGMKLTDVGIATLAKGYKGFKGNCSISFIEQFRALHQCNKYCEMMGLKSLRTAHQKQRKIASLKSKTLTGSSTTKKAAPKKAREPRDFISSEH